MNCKSFKKKKSFLFVCFHYFSVGNTIVDAGLAYIHVWCTHWVNQQIKKRLKNLSHRLYHYYTITARAHTTKNQSTFTLTLFSRFRFFWNFQWDFVCERAVSFWWNLFLLLFCMLRLLGYVVEIVICVWFVDFTIRFFSLSLYVSFHFCSVWIWKRLIVKCCFNVASKHTTKKNRNKESNPRFYSNQTITSKYFFFQTMNKPFTPWKNRKRKKLNEQWQYYDIINGSKGWYTITRWQ